MAWGGLLNIFYSGFGITYELYLPRPKHPGDDLIVAQRHGRFNSMYVFQVEGAPGIVDFHRTIYDSHSPSHHIAQLRASIK